MNTIRPFSKKEYNLVKEIIELLLNARNDEIVDFIKTQKYVLKTLAQSISLYPSIFMDDTVESIYQSVEDKIISITNSSPEEIQFNIPTKAVLGKSFIIAKINFWYLLLYFSRDIPCINHLYDRIFHSINEAISLLLAEEVFLEIIMDPDNNYFLKNYAVKMLFDIWENRLVIGIDSYVPLLINMWEARKTFEPVFGTMMGTSEYFMFSNNADPQIMEFLENYEFKDDEEIAVQEFLFGLSYENLEKLKSEMQEHNLSVVNKDEILDFLNKNQIHTGYGKNDPRDFYSFFIERKNNATARSRYRLPGPKKTLEEHIMCYLIEQKL